MKKTDKAFDALGDPTRRAIFEKLKSKPLPVGALAKGFAVSRPAVSQHLKVLKDAGLISIDAAGTRNFYSINPDGVLAMRDYLNGFWNDALNNFKLLAEKKHSGK